VRRLGSARLMELEVDDWREGGGCTGRCKGRLFITRHLIPCNIPTFSLRKNEPLDARFKGRDRCCRALCLTAWLGRVIQVVVESQ
jgi:hypothetical protein